MQAPTPATGSASRAIVGRFEEWAALQGALGRALGGLPSLVLLRGEAGMGKTTLLRELRGHAQARGVDVVAGRCHEVLSLPYLAFAQSLFPRLAAAAASMPELSGGAALRQFSGSLSEDASAAQRRDLFLAVSGGLLALARSQPLLLTIDDLQWADPSSLDLFEHISFSVADAAETGTLPLLIVAAFRSTDSNARLEQAMARIRREGVAETIDLEGLGALEVDELVRQHGVSHPSGQLVESVRRASGGNPLLAIEIVDYLRKHDALRETRGLVHSRVPESSFPLPAEITRPIQERLAGLSVDCRRLLQLAACDDRPFSTKVLMAATGAGPDAVLDLLEEARGAGLAGLDGEEYQFEHVIVRAAVYTSQSPARRRRDHQLLAQTLERLYGDAAGDHALEIAHHLLEAGALAEPEKVQVFARAAGDRARDVFSWADAVRFYDCALEAADAREEGDTPDLAGLCYATAYAHHRSNDIQTALELYERAADLYRQRDDRRSVALVLAEVLNAGLHGGPGLTDPMPLREALEALPDGDPVQGKLCAELAQTHLLAGDDRAAEDWARRALEASRETGSHEDAAKAYVVLGRLAARHLDFTVSAGLYEEGLAQARAADNSRTLAVPAQRAPAVLLACGRLDDAVSLAAEGHDAGLRSGALGGSALALGATIGVETLRGDLAALERHGREASMLINRSAYLWAAPAVHLGMAASHFGRGQWKDAEDCLNEDGLGGRVQGLFGAMIRTARAADEGSQSSAETSWPAPGRPDIDTLCQHAAYIELATQTTAAMDVSVSVDVLSRALENGGVFTPNWPFLIPRVLGLGAARADDFEEATTWFERAIEAAGASGARAELARTLVDYAHHLAGAGAGRDPNRAAELLQQASPLASELGLLPLLRRTEKLADSLGVTVTRPAAQKPAPRQAPRAAPSAAPVERFVQTMAVVFFTDLVDSVPITNRLGDRAAKDLVDKLHGALEKAIEEFGGVLAPGVTLGDGRVATFTSAGRAIQCAFRCRDEATALGVQLHIGLHAGDILRGGDAISGGVVNIAARVLSECPPGDILVSQTVRELARTSLDVIFSDLGLHDLKGLPEPQRLFSVQAAAAGA